MGAVGRAHDVRLLPGVFAALVEEGDGRAEDVAVHQYCPITHFRDFLTPVGAGDRVRAHPRVPRERAFAVMRGSDVLLLLPATAREFKQVGLKEIEYVASGTPVLVLGEPLEEFLPLLEAASQVEIARSA